MGKISFIFISTQQPKKLVLKGQVYFFSGLEMVLVYLFPVLAWANKCDEKKKKKKKNVMKKVAKNTSTVKCLH